MLYKIKQFGGGEIIERRILMAKIKFKQIIEKIGSQPILASSLVFVLASVIVIGLTLIKYGYKGNFEENIMVEAHGMLFDILVIGIFIFTLHSLGKKRLESQGYQDEIDDFREWKSEEATYRILGNIKRLNRNGVTKIDLSNCYLEKATLREAQLQGADLTEANLQGTDLREAQLQGGDLTGANLRGADLREAQLQGADLADAKLQGAHLQKAQLQGAHLGGAKLQGAYLYQANLQGASLYQVNLQGEDLREANLQEADLYQANLENAQLREANLQGALLHETIFEGADLSKANLKGAYLHEPDFQNANLWQANLQGVEFTITRAEKKDLTGDQLSNVKTLYEAIIDPILLKQIKKKYPHLLEKPEWLKEDED